MMRLDKVRKGNAESNRVEDAAYIMFMLSNSVRLRALIHLSEHEYSVSELGEKLGVSQSVISQHLARLRRSKLVNTRREKQTVFYSCNHVLVLKFLNELGLACD